MNRLKIFFITEIEYYKMESFYNGYDVAVKDISRYNSPFQGLRLMA